MALVHSPLLDQAAAHLEAGRYQQAKALLLRILQRNPRDPMANVHMTCALLQLGEAQQGLYYGERALALAGEDPNILSNMATLHLHAGNDAKALELYQRAHARSADHIASLLGLTQTLLHLWRLEDARAHAAAGLERAPNEPRLIGNLASALVQMGRGREAAELLRPAVAAHPDHAALVTALAGALNYIDGVEPSEILEAHRRYGLLLERSGIRPLPPAPARDADRPLRIGLISADLRVHPVGFFAQPFLRLGKGFELCCYSTGAVEDEVSRRYRAAATVWRSVARMPHAELARQIRADRVDILVDLAGHAWGNRLPVMHMRPAPVQVVAIGYPATTGLSAIDYRLVDSHTDPEGFEAHAVERLERLDPCFLAYAPPDDAPAITRCAGEGGIVFGSFSALAKLDDTTIRLWSRVLAAVPDSRLLCKALGYTQKEVRDLTLGRFAAAGADASRIELAAPTADKREHMAWYNRLDVALDTYPYHGTTTTCEALLMGVPVVTLAGRVSAARVGVSLLRGAGMGELVAESEDEYVAMAAGLAEAQRLAQARAGLRERFLSSAVCDQGAMAARLAEALRGMWRRAVESGA